MKYKPWIPQKVCKTCVEVLRLWTNKKRNKFRYETTMIWNEPMNHHDDCYFCLVDITGINRKNRAKWEFPCIRSAHRRVLSPKISPEPQADVPQEEPMHFEAKTDSSDSDFPKLSAEKIKSGRFWRATDKIVNKRLKFYGHYDKDWEKGMEWVCLACSKFFGK